MLHDYFANSRFASIKPFQGHTELFLIEDIEELLNKYEEILSDS